MRLTENQLRDIIRVTIKEAIKRPSVFMHVTGNTGCGKTTLMGQLMTDYPQYIFFDLDEFGELATNELGWDHGWGQKGWTEEKGQEWKEMTQKVAEDFITSADKPIVFFGIHHNTTKGVPDPYLFFNAQHKLFMDTDPELCAERKFSRDQKRMEVYDDGSIYIGGSTIKKPWTKPGISLKDPIVIDKIMEALVDAVHVFNNEVISMGYQPVNENEIRDILDENN